MLWGHTGFGVTLERIAFRSSHTVAPDWVSVCRLNQADKRQDNQDDHHGPNDVNDIVHENYLFI
jgi:hypothetical protein